MLAVSSVQSEREHERAGLRHFEEVVTLKQRRGAGEVCFGIETAVGGPGPQIAAGDAEVDAAETSASHERIVERIRERDLADLGVAAVLRELLDDVRVRRTVARVPAF